jgi:hypothetical protein
LVTLRRLQIPLSMTAMTRADIAHNRNGHAQRRHAEKKFRAHFSTSAETK